MRGAQARRQDDVAEAERALVRGNDARPLAGRRRPSSTTTRSPTATWPILACVSLTAIVRRAARRAIPADVEVQDATGARRVDHGRRRLAVVGAERSARASFAAVATAAVTPGIRRASSTAAARDADAVRCQDEIGDHALRALVLRSACSRVVLRNTSVEDTATVSTSGVIGGGEAPRGGAHVRQREEPADAPAAAEDARARARPRAGRRAGRGVRRRSPSSSTHRPRRRTPCPDRCSRRRASSSATAPTAATTPPTKRMAPISRGSDADCASACVGRTRAARRAGGDHREPAR